MTIHVPFENSYARLPDRFYARLAPTPVGTPRLVRLNEGLAAELGLDENTAMTIRPTDLISLKELEQAHVTNVLEATGGNKTKACEILGITRAALYNKLSRMEGQLERERQP